MVVTTQVVALGALVPAVLKMNRRLNPERVPLLGLSAAFVFTAQLLSFPVPGGTSVHISGVVLASILLGPLSGYVITAAALALQLFLFQHGGLSTYGANLVNMGLLPCLLGYWIYQIGKRIHPLLAAALAVWVTKIISALLCAFELSYSGFLPLKSGLTAMGMAHVFAGLIEAMVTVTILSLFMKLRGELLDMEKL